MNLSVTTRLRLSFLWIVGIPLLLLANLRLHADSASVYVAMVVNDSGRVQVERSVHGHFLRDDSLSRWTDLKPLFAHRAECSEMSISLVAFSAVTLARQTTTSVQLFYPTTAGAFRDSGEQVRLFESHTTRPPDPLERQMLDAAFAELRRLGYGTAAELLQSERYHAFLVEPVAWDLLGVVGAGPVFILGQGRTRRDRRWR